MTRHPLLALVSGALLSCLAVAVTASAVLSRGAPQAVLAIWPMSAEAQSRRAENLVAGGAPADLARARPLAERALRRQPVNVIAARTLAIIAAQQGDDAGARGRLLLAEWLSRRDLPTQIALIESHVQGGDVPGALVHYDRAMQASIASRDILLPVLTAAADDIAVAQPVAALLARRPYWWEDFFDRFAQSSRDPAAFATIADALRLRSGRSDETDRLAIAINHLVGLGDIARAKHLYSTARSPAAASAMLRDGSFESGDTLPPFEWALVADEERAGVREYRDGAIGKAALSLTGTAAGTVARQLLVLPPGAYLLTSRIGQSAVEGGSAPSITLACLGSAAVPGAVLKTASMPAVKTTASWQISFEVGAAQCAAQWLSINAGANVDTTSVSPWIDDIRIVARP